MSLDFTAIDFETANPQRGSVCSVGLAKFRDGRLVDRYQQIVRPPAGLSEFSHWNVRVHGITAEMVAGMPNWDVVFPEVDTFIANDLLVAHNAAFDVSVLVGACAAYQISPRPNQYLCTIELAKTQFTLANFKLPTVAAALGVDLANHHDALCDAIATGEVAAALLAGRGYNVATFGAGLPIDVLGAKRTRRPRTGGHGSTFSSFRAASYVPNADADPTHFFFGKKFVFTGQMETLSREEAAELVIARGGQITGSVSKLTSVLVVGGWDPTSLGDGQQLSGKAAKAIEVLKAGHPIQVWTEHDLITNL